MAASSQTSSIHSQLCCQTKLSCTMGIEKRVCLAQDKIGVFFFFFKAVKLRPKLEFFF